MKKFVKHGLKLKLKDQTKFLSWLPCKSKKLQWKHQMEFETACWIGI